MILRRASAIGPMQSEPDMRYIFANCELDTQCYRLRRADLDVPLRPKAFHLLVYLIEHRDRVVSKQELCDHIWKERFVSDATVENSVKLVRQAVGDNGRAQRLIQTFYRHGYRFVAPVTVHSLPTHQGFGERKVVSILCCGLAHTLPQAGARDLDTLHRRLHRLHGLVQQESRHYGGTLQPITEQHILIVFGVPVAQEDHAQRAVLPALALHRRAAAEPALFERLALRLGIHTGAVAVGGIGEFQEAAMAMVGHAISLAVTLYKSAAAGTMLCSATTAHCVERSVHLMPCQPLWIEDGESRVEVYQIVGHRTHREVGRRHARWN
ncbi:hypothetical protein C2W62_09575, partial [Candidatus Entotheonella serta]